MTDFTDELAHAAGAEIAAAREATLRARMTHARAELMRHMMLTTAKSLDKAREESVRLVVDEWLDAWQRTRDNYPYVPQMEALAGACHDALRTPNVDTDRAVRDAFAALEHACFVRGTTLGDEMAWRSGCSHGWWSDVRPSPGGEYAERSRRGEALWERGCPQHCLG